MVEINKICAVDYHRNGIAGHGFYVCDFIWSDEYNSEIEARAVVFGDSDGQPEHYAITTKDPSEKWRGDHFIDLLWVEIQSAMDRRWQALISKTEV
jgi:hypothetical protein